MADMPKRDVTGKCDEGECKDRVHELEEEQQKKMNKEGMKGSTEETTSPEHAKKRDNPPGGMGGHV